MIISDDSTLTLKDEINKGNFNIVINLNAITGKNEENTEKIFNITKGDTTHDFLHHVSSTDDILYTIRITGGLAIIFYDLYSGIDTIGNIIEIPDDMIEDMKGCVFNKISISTDKTAYVISFKNTVTDISVSYKLYCHSKPETEEGMISRIGCKVFKISEDNTKYVEIHDMELHGKEDYEINKADFL